MPDGPVLELAHYLSSEVFDPECTSQAFYAMSRDKCIIVHMAYIRCVITTGYVLLVPPDDDRSSIFLARLKERISQPQGSVGK